MYFTRIFYQEFAEIVTNVGSCELQKAIDCAGGHPDEGRTSPSGCTAIRSCL